MIITFHTAKGAASRPEFWPAYWKSVDGGYTTLDFLPEYRVLMRYLAPKQDVLDIGCGRGMVVRDLQRRGYTVRGIDFDADSIFDSVAQAGYFPSEVGDLNHLPYRDASFDAVLLAGTIEHVFDGPEKGFAEISRVLRPGGILVLTIPYINLLRKLLLPFYLSRDIIFSYLPEQRRRRFFEYVFTRSEVKRLLARTGLSVMECRRAYYTTSLRKIPGFIKLTGLIFARNSGKPASAGAPRSSSTPKSALKKFIEGTLNLIVPNRLVVVARKPAR
ncbi:MAG TPA: class I SAM-dependent methyltransferase [Bryobacteraceae bacterium]|nr:class I SAM-dependent methyltransferase [Bryobacteraceae bacterium]